MTRKHYKQLAEAFARLRSRLEEDYPGNPDANTILEDIENEVCLVLQQDNPEFSRHKFTTASGRKD